MALTGIRIAGDSMTEESIDDVLNRFPQPNGEAKMLSAEELKQEYDKRQPRIVDTPHRYIKALRAFDEEKGKRVLCGNLVWSIFYRVVKPEHYVWKYKGYGIQEDAFQLLVTHGYKHIVLIKHDWKPTTENGKHLVSLVENWAKSYIPVDNLGGHGEQRFFKEEDMIFNRQLDKK